MMYKDTNGSSTAKITLLDFLNQIPSIFWVAGLPFLVVFAASTPVNQAGWLDPFVYAAYVNDFASTSVRFGQTYYSSRIAYILPDSIFQRAFGAEFGYLLIRALFLALATGSVFAIAHRFYGRLVAILVACWVCLLPWLPRALYWTHYDGFAVTYLLIAIALLTVPTRYRLAAHFGAGLFWMMAINCQIYLLAVGGLFLASWAILNSRETVGWFV
ncbi:MAG: hypothetical protein AAF870_02805, partial [Pseudomonadota bacterium]